MQSIINGFRKYNINEKTGLTEDILAFYPESYINKGENYSSLKEEEIICDFIIKEKLGEGAFGSVRLGVNKQTGEKVAIKILDKSKIMKYEDKIRIEREIEILKKLRHPNIMRLYSIIETDKQILLITEYIKGQELFQYILLKKKLSEEEACLYFSQIVSGIEYLHKLKIAHRDIKSENIIIEQNTKIIKIIDFGLSNTYGDKDEELLRSSCGSPFYAAPEMLKGDIYKGNKVDIWSMGVVLYLMICGSLPFQDEDNSKLFQKIIKGKYTIPMHVSNHARDLLYKLIEINPKKRINITQIKRHPWIKLYCPEYLNQIGRIFDIGLNSNKYMIPIDEEILSELNDKYNLPKDRIKNNILKNKTNDYTTLYEILLNKKIREGKKSVADLKSDLFFNYINDKNNLISKHNKLNKNINIEKSENKNLNLNRNFVKSQEDFYKNISYKNNNTNNIDIYSPNFYSQKYIKNDIINNNRNKNILDLKFSPITENEKTFKLNSSKVLPIDNNAINNIKNNKKCKYNKNNNITSSCKRNKMNSLDKIVFNDKKAKHNINYNNIKKRTRKNGSLDFIKTEERKIDQILNNNKDSNNSVNTNQNNENINNSNLQTKENKNNLDNFKGKIKQLLPESQVINLEESKETTKEKISQVNEDKNDENNQNNIQKNTSNEQIITKSNINDNSQSNNYLTTDEKIKNAQTLDSFSLKNYNDENLFSIQNENMISFYPKKPDNQNNKINHHKDKLYKNKNRYKVYNNRINLMKNKLQNAHKKVNYKHKQDCSADRSKTLYRISQSEIKRKYFKNRKTGITPINKRPYLKRLININILDNYLDTFNFNKTKNESITNIQRLNQLNIKKYNSIDNEFESIKSIKLKQTSSVKRERNAEHKLKKEQKRNNRIFSSITQLNEDLPLIEDTSRKTISSNKINKKFKFKEKSEDIIIHRNRLIKKSNSLFLEDQIQYSNDKKDTSEILNIKRNKVNINKTLNQKNLFINENKILLSERNKTIKNDNILNEKENEFNYIPFDLSCVFISSRKNLKQKFVSICEKMKYKIKNINLYKFNVISGDTINNIFEINLPKNKLGILNIKKHKIGSLELDENIRKVISKLNKKI